MSSVPDFDTLQTLVIATLFEVVEQGNKPVPESVEGSTSLVGKQAVLDSLALVTLIVELEQRLEEEYDVMLTLADDRAMSQKHSPFRTVASLTHYIAELISEEMGRD